MRYLGRHAWAIVALILSVGGVAGFVLVGGGRMFSPGGLNAKSRRAATLGGVSSHAALGGDCAACHVGPLSSGTMADRCMNCHTDVRRQLDAHQPIHGAMSEGARCRSCHTEHHGAQAAVTDLSRFDHDWAAFKLTGKHRQVDCRSCHRDEAYQDAPQTCASCHAEPKLHKGRFGVECAQCHSTTTWEGAVFKHTFPLTHGRRRNPIECATCHTAPDHYQTYTCYGCHEHEPSRIARRHRRIVNFENCVRCHPTGREHDGRRGGG
jgi:hypothetical protein